MKNTTTLIEAKHGAQLESKNEVSPISSTQEKATYEERVKELHSELQGLGKHVLNLAMEAGEILCKIKNDGTHGNWESYVKNDLGIHPRTASNYMRLFSKEDDIKKWMKEKSVSDLGVRQALNYLAKKNKDENELPSDDPAKPLVLTDESKLSEKKIYWKEGLISKASLEVKLEELASTCDADQDKKVTARQQRFVAEIVASINRCSPKSKPEKAVKIAQAALETVSQLMSKFETASQKG